MIRGVHFQTMSVTGPRIFWFNLLPHRLPHGQFNADRHSKISDKLLI